jgi:propionyl-CoA carboxylase alpha chain
MHTALLDERLATWTAADERAVAKAALAAAIGAATAAAASAPVLSRIPVAWRNAPSQPRVRTLVRGGQRYAVSYTRVGPGLVSSFVDGVSVVEAAGDRVVLLDGEVRSTYRVAAENAFIDIIGPDGAYSFDQAPVFVDPALAIADGSLRSPMPALVTAVLVAPGDEVRRGDPVVVVEAMKMQHTIAAPADGVVTALTVSVGQQVTAGAPLAVIEEKP